MCYLRQKVVSELVGVVLGFVEESKDATTSPSAFELASPFL